MRKILLIIGVTLLIFQMIVLAVDIDIGSPAIGRPSSAYLPYTYVNVDNPANESGTITQVELWSQTNIADCVVATFYVVSGNNLSTRDTYYIGSVALGAKRTFGVNLTVEAGDYIGINATSGDLEAHSAGYAGLWRYSGDAIPCTNVLFILLAGDTMSLYGTGTTVEEEENAIFFGINF